MVVSVLYINLNNEFSITKQNIVKFVSSYNLANIVGREISHISRIYTNSQFYSHTHTDIHIYTISY